jgi:hypothetical protein
MALSDDELVSSFRETVIDQDLRLVNQLDHIVELDRRKLYYHYDSLRAFLVGEHGLEETQADRLIRAARIMKRHPEIRDLLLRGKLSIKLIEIIQGCASREKLGDAEYRDLIEAVSGKSCNAARGEIASRYPLTSELPPDRIRPLNVEFSELRCVISRLLEDGIEDVRGILAHSHPGATIGEILAVVITEFRRRHHPEEKARRAQARQEKRKEKERRSDPVDSPAPARNAAKKRVFSEAQGHEMILSAGYRCAYQDPVTGVRCASRFGLEKDHVQAWSEGGATIIDNARYLCHAHHRRITYLQFGEFKPKSDSPETDRKR